MKAPFAAAPLGRPAEIALVVLASLAAIAVAKWAQAFLIPLTAGILIAYALKPVVAVLERLHVHRVIGAVCVLAALTGLIVGGLSLVRDDAVAALAELPYAARKLRVAAQESAREPRNPITHLREAAAELSRAAALAVGVPSSAVQEPPAAPAANELREWGAAQSSKFLSVAADLGLAALLAMFLLASGDTFRKKVLSLAGPTLAARRITREILDEIDAQVQRYLLVMLVTNTFLGLCIWLLLTVAGVERAGLWATIAGVLHFVPYAGTALTTVAIGMAAYLQFGTMPAAFAVALAVLAISSAIGMGLLSWLQGRAGHMNPVAVFVTLLFFGWLWGGWGLLLGAPLVAIFRAIAERLPSMQAVGELAGP
ncbi:MAG TPA: AI-2E family transporter [Casimicrobiaceae bacterium]|jgi:predicted PurR-regulated permease PerM